MPKPSRNENILRSIIDGTEYTEPAQSREEALLIELKDAIGSGGGGGGTSDYSALTNKPSINDVSLIGNKTSSDLGLVSAVSGKGLSTEDYTTAEKNKLSSITNPLVIKGQVETTLSLPSDAEVGWVYFVGSDSDTDLAEYVYTSDSRWEKIGTFDAETDLSNYYTKTEVDDSFLLKTDSIGVKVPNGGEKFNDTSNNVASGNFSHAEGTRTSATGNHSHAEGGLTIASGDNAHVEGISTQSTANGSHAEGGASRATYEFAHAEGYGSYSHGHASHAEGHDTNAGGAYSHAEGEYTNANNTCSHAEGYHTTASSSYQHVEGRYNIEDSNSKYAFIIGNGDSNSRSNAFAIDWDGNVYTGNSGVGVNIEELTEEIAELRELIESLQNN